MKKLVIVESPAKARTLSKMLGRGYTIKASMGHVRDLPKSQLGVDVDNSFAPRYIIPRGKTKTANELKKAAREASAIYLATDPDREGEAISWHLIEVIKGGDKPHHRVVFHEITKEAIKHAFKQPRNIDTRLVNAQQARRILDRLVGYKLSPFLWRKVRRGLSAGRVQSVALKIIVEREREIEGFTSEEYWAIEAELLKNNEAKTPSFRATLTTMPDGSKPKIGDKQQTDEILSELKEAAYSVAKMKKKEVSRRPTPPFITSTLQQEAWRKLRFSAKQTMAIAQQLYEGLPVGDEGSVGLITYMRTDSTRVAHAAVAEARDYITSTYGAQYVPQRARQFATKVKGAQDAHEAIRPTKVLRKPSLIKPYLNLNQLKLYELIWKRMVASQMAEALFDSTTLDVDAKRPYVKGKYGFRTQTQVNTFPGFMALYTEGKDEEDDKAKKSPTLPPLQKGDGLDLKELLPEQRFTQPPPRFTEATLVRALEHNGIGRPSTYAPTLSTIQDREYAGKEKGRLKPTELGMAVADLLVKHFPDIVDIKFTANMEGELDGIANDDTDWAGVVGHFYEPFENDLTAAAESAEKVKLADELIDETCPNCDKPLAVKTGRYGKFLACSGYPECKFTKPYQIKTGVKCPECGEELVKKITKKKKVFYGCSGYPNCRFGTNFKPLPQPCPNCGSLLTEYRGKWAKCTKCDYKAKLEEE